MGYSNGNKSFTGRLFSNYGWLNMLFHFFRYLIYCFSRDFCQRVYEETVLSQHKFPKLILRCSILLKIKTFNFVKWRLFEDKKLKNLSIFGAVFSEIKNADILNFSWIKYFGNDFSFLIKWHIWVYYCWNYGPSNLKAELKADFWLQIGIYSRKNCPRHGSGQLPPANS